MVLVIFRFRLRHFAHCVNLITNFPLATLRERTSRSMERSLSGIGDTVRLSWHAVCYAGAGGTA
jgi:hypothetical protein